MKKAVFTVRAASWTDDRDALQSVRIPVFVQEQHVDAREEFDDVDLTCQHILAVDTSGNAVGTGRIDVHGKIGRMAVLTDWRKQGVGRAILRKAIELARDLGLRRVYLHAQTSALGFYEREGFVPYGEHFLEAGIDHRAMELRL